MWFDSYGRRDNTNRDESSVIQSDLFCLSEVLQGIREQLRVKMAEASNTLSPRSEVKTVNWRREEPWWDLACPLPETHHFEWITGNNKPPADGFICTKRKRPVSLFMVQNTLQDPNTRRIIIIILIIFSSLLTVSNTSVSFCHTFHQFTQRFSYDALDQFVLSTRSVPNTGAKVEN